MSAERKQVAGCWLGAWMRSPAGLFLLPSLAAMAIRLVLFAFALNANPQIILAPDSITYLNPARCMLACGAFSESPFEPASPESFRTPGYPLFLAAGMVFLGDRVQALALAQIVAVSLAAGITSLAGARIAGPRAGLCAGLVLALEPVSAIYSMKILTESFFALVFSLAMLAATYSHHPRAGSRSAWGFGLLLAMLPFIRPVAVYMPPLVAAGTWAFGRIAGWPFRKAAITAMACLLPWMAGTGAWMARNQVLLGDASFCHITGASLYLYRLPGAIALRDGISFEQAQAEAARRLPSAAGMNDAERGLMMKRLALAELRQVSPLLILKSQVQGVINTLAGYGNTDLYSLFGKEPDPGILSDALGMTPGDYVDKWVRGRTAYFFVAMTLIAFTLAQYGLALTGWFCAWTSRPEFRFLGLLLGGIFLYLLILPAGPEAYSRFRVPFVPLFAMYAGIGWTCAWKWMVGLKTRFRKAQQEPKET